MPEPSSAKPAQSSRSVLGIFGTRAGLFPIKIVVAFLVIKILGPARYGAYTFLMLGGELFLPLLFLGFGGGITYAISSGRHSVQDIALSNVAIGLLHGTLTALLMFGLWYWGLESARDIPFNTLWPALLVLPLQGINLMMYRTLMGASWFGVMNTYYAIMNILPPILLTVFVLVAGLGLWGAVLSIVGFSVTLCIFILYVVWKRARPKWSIRWPFIREGYHYGIREWFGSLSVYTNLRLDQAILSAFPPEILGVYSAAAKISELLWLAPDAVGPVLFNRIATGTTLTERARLTSQIHRIMIFITALLAIGLAFASPLVPWFLDKYKGIETVIWLLIPGTVAFVTTKVLTKFFSGSGRPEWSSMSQATGMLVTVAGAFTLIPWFGLQGAGITSSLAYTATALTAIVLFRRHTQPASFSLFRLRISDFRWIKSQVMGAIGK